MTSEELNHVYTIRDLWQKLAVPGNPPRPGQAVSSPFREDKHPSFVILPDGFGAYDHGTSQHYSAIDFFGAVREIPHEKQVPEYSTWLAQLGVLVKRMAPTLTLTEVAKLPAPTTEQIRQIAEVRKLSPSGIHLAANWGVLRIGELFGQTSWILTDDSYIAAEARRLDGKPYEAIGDLGERKAHTLKGSKKDWPIGLKLKTIDVAKISNAVLCEGGPDYLAAMELIFVWGDSNALPLTMLGAHCLIGVEAIKLLVPKSIQIIAHTDATRTGEDGALRRQNQLSFAGCKNVSITRLPLPYGDLNDFLARTETPKKQNAALKLYGNHNHK